MDDTRRLLLLVVLWVGLLGALALSQVIVRQPLWLWEHPVLTTAQPNQVLPLPPDTHLAYLARAARVTFLAMPAPTVPLPFCDLPLRETHRHMPKVHGSASDS